MNRSASIAARIRDEILGGAYRPGERLPAERHLATQLGVNRGSLREALKRLEQLGLVTTRRGGGTTVRPLHEAGVEIVRHLIQVGDGVDRRLLEQFLDVHEMLLAGASYLAVERAGPAEVERARRLLERLAAASDPAEFHDLTGELVDVITEASGNLVLQLWRNSLQPLLREGLQRLRPHLARDLEPLRGALAAVDAALVDGDPAATERSVRALYRLRREWILAAIDAAAAERGGAGG